MVIVMLTQEKLKELLQYNTTSGEFKWIRSKGRAKAGSVAGCTDKDGYILIGINSRLYKAHRLAFLYMTGSMPSIDLDVDHINGITGDNRWDNLRIATRSQNSMNRDSKGYYYSSKQSKYRALIQVGYKKIDLGGFDTEQEARSAYLNAVDKYHGEFGRK
jgi:hypothetical protein